MDPASVGGRRREMGMNGCHQHRAAKAEGELSLCTRVGRVARLEMAALGSREFAASKRGFQEEGAASVWKLARKERPTRAAWGEAAFQF